MFTSAQCRLPKCLRMRARELIRERAEPPTLATCALTPVPVMRAPITLIKRRTSARVWVSFICSLRFSLVDCLVSLPQLVSFRSTYTFGALFGNSLSCDLYSVYFVDLRSRCPVPFAETELGGREYFSTLHLRRRAVAVYYDVLSSFSLSDNWFQVLKLYRRVILERVQWYKYATFTLVLSVLSIIHYNVTTR